MRKAFVGCRSFRGVLRGGGSLKVDTTLTDSTSVYAPEDWSVEEDPSGQVLVSGNGVGVVEVCIPHRSNIRVDSEGLVQMNGFIQGDVDILAKGGIVINRVRGTKVRLETLGNISVTNLEASELQVDCDRFEVKKLMCKRMDLKSSETYLQAAYVNHGFICSKGNVFINGYHGKCSIHIQNSNAVLQVKSLSGSLNAQIDCDASVSVDELMGDTLIDCKAATVSLPTDQQIEFKLTSPSIAINNSKVNITQQNSAIMEGHTVIEKSRATTINSGKINLAGKASSPKLEIISSSIDLRSLSWMDRIKMKHFPEQY